MRIVLHWRTRRVLENERARAKMMGHLDTFERCQALLVLEYMEQEEEMVEQKHRQIPFRILIGPQPTI